jgi:hypothetical protein
MIMAEPEYYFLSSILPTTPYLYVELDVNCAKAQTSLLDNVRHRTIGIIAAFHVVRIAAAVPIRKVLSLRLNPTLSTRGQSQHAQSHARLARAGFVTARQCKAGPVGRLASQPREIRQYESRRRRASRVLRERAPAPASARSHRSAGRSAGRCAARARRIAYAC